MPTTSESLAFDRGVRAMLEIVLLEKADAVIGFRADPELQANQLRRDASNAFTPVPSNPDA